MATYIEQISRTFNEFLLIPNLTHKDCIPDNVSLKTPITRYKRDSKQKFEINLPFASAIMQSVSDDVMAVSLAQRGGISFIYGSQSIEKQCDMVSRVKKYKAGFVVSKCNLTVEHTLKDVLNLKEKTGHSTCVITHDGTENGELMGIVTSKDYRLTRHSLGEKVKDFMTPMSQLICGEVGITLSQANDLIWDNKLNCLPIIDNQKKLHYLVFRKDYSEHKKNPLANLDQHKRYIVGAGINTRDYRERVPALLGAGVDILCIDSSDGFTEWQKETLQYIKKEYGTKVKVGAGNIVDKEGFLYLAQAGADFVKVGIGGGSICITREQKGIGRGQATALKEVVEARDKLYKETDMYIPICSDGGIVHDNHITLALAMGADFVMMGRYFARFDESPGKKMNINGKHVKEYWAEGSNRARNWQRYDLGGEDKLSFEEGVDSYVPYAGSLRDNMISSVYKIKSTMCNCGATTIKELHNKARITLVSENSIYEGSAHDVELKNRNINID